MNTTKLTFDDIKNTAPAVFSVNPHPRLSDKYKFFSTAQIIEPMIAEGWFPTRCGQARVYGDNRQYTNHFVALSREDLIYSGERIEALLFNSHDGRKRFLYELGVFRGICANGCVWSDESFGELRLRHLGYSPEQVQEACEAIADRAPQVVERINAWKNLTLSWEQKLELARFGLKLRWPRQALFTAVELLQVRRSEDAHPDLWTVFSRIQESLIRGGTHYARESGKQRRGTTRAVTSIGTGLSINKRLWEGANAIAEGMALPA